MIECLKKVVSSGRVLDEAFLKGKGNKKNEAPSKAHQVVGKMLCLAFLSFKSIEGRSEESVAKVE